MQTFLDFIDPRDFASPPYAAAARNRLGTMQLLHDLRADINKFSSEGICPLYKAAANNHLAMVRLMHKLRAELETGSRDGTVY